MTSAVGPGEATARARLPSVSVVVTAHNDERTIEEAIESTLAQDWRGPLEILVVLDGPEDGTAERARRYDARVSLIEKENGGTASARNAGLRQASGEWIQFLDGDDVLLPTKLSASFAAYHAAFNRSEIALIYTGYHHVDPGGRVLDTHYAEAYDRERLLKSDGFVTPNPIIRADTLRAVGGYSPAYVYAEDTEVYHRLALQRKMLAVCEPHFLKRVSESQKSIAMRRHPTGNPVADEPLRIRRTYAEAFERHPPRWLHPVGALSQRGVLDVGLKCTHSCRFCYYSYLDGSDDQFRGMRHASLRSLGECKGILRHMADVGLTHFDVTGGEPTIHRDLVEIVRYGFEELGLKARVITLGQFLMRRVGKGETRSLLDRLLEAGLDDFLLSVHAVDEALFGHITGEKFSRLREAMDALDDRDFSYCTNTVVHEANHRHLPEIAEHLLGRRVRIANFIVMNTYYEWKRGERALGVKARYRDIRPYLEHAVRVLEEAGVGVNVRYGPLCAYRGLEKNFVGVLGVELDPYEWRTDLRTGAFRDHEGVAGYLAEQRAMLSAEDSLFAKERRCEGCAVEKICDGVDTTYVAEHGWAEFRPYRADPDRKPITDPIHFRRNNPLVFELKCEREAPPAEGADERLFSLLFGNLRWSETSIDLLSQGRVEDAVELLEAARSRSPGDTTNDLKLQRLHLLRGDAAQAEAITRRFESTADAPVRDVLRARLTSRPEILADRPNLRQRLLDEVLGDVGARESP